MDNQKRFQSCCMRNEISIIRIIRKCNYSPLFFSSTGRYVCCRVQAVLQYTSKVVWLYSTRIVKRNEIVRMTYGEALVAQFTTFMCPNHDGLPR